MDFENRNSFGSVRKLRDRFEQNNLDVHLNNNINCDKNRNTFVIKDVIHNNDTNDGNDRSGPQCKQIKSIADKSFAEKLNKTLRNDNKMLNPKFKLNKSNDNPLVSSDSGPYVSPVLSSVSKNNEFDMSFSCEPNPVPKPPRTFAHDVYLELKFNTKNSNNNLDEKLSALYSQPNKANKLKNRLRSQSDSKVIETKKSNEFKSNENIYDDCINTRNIDKTLKSKLLQFSCLKFKRR